MKRLTKRERNSDGTGIAKFDVTTVNNSLTKAGRNIITKLADYEDLEEQGLLMRLPCKVRTEVYYILGIPNKTPCTIDKCVFKLSDIDKIGKSLFLTPEEAEKKLEEMKSC